MLNFAETFPCTADGQPRADNLSKRRRYRMTITETQSPDPPLLPLLPSVQIFSCSFCGALIERVYREGRLEDMPKAGHRMTITGNPIP